LASFLKFKARPNPAAGYLCFNRNWFSGKTKNKEYKKSGLSETMANYYQVGYNNKTSFSQTFKKYTRLTPSQFRAGLPQVVSENGVR